MVWFMLNMIHDLDEMLYPAYPGAHDIMGDAAANAAVEDCGVAVTFAQARVLIDKSFAERNDWRDLLVEAHGIDADLLHAAYHKRLDHRLITPYPNLSQCFAALGARASHVILTHSAAEWAMRTVDHLSLRPWFPDERILSWEKYKAHKGVSTRGFEMALETLGGVDPRAAVFADDGLRNLATAKAMGLTTVWTSHGKTLPQGHARDVDHVVENIEVFMRQQVALLAP